MSQSKPPIFIRSIRKKISLDKAFFEVFDSFEFHFSIIINSVGFLRDQTCGLALGYIVMVKFEN